MSEFVEVSRDGDIAVVTLNRPKVNALSIAMLDQLTVEFAALNDDLPRAVLLWGGQSKFSAGADIEEMGTPEVAHEFTEAFRRATRAIEALPRLVVAAVAGFALGGGLEIALAADFRIASADATFGTPEIKLGLLPGGGATARLPCLVGIPRALQLLVGGETIDAASALEWRLIDRIIDVESFEQDARAFVTELAAGPTIAQAHIKQVLRDYRIFGVDGAENREQTAFIDIFHSADAAEGLAAFREKRMPKFH